ncbi:MAG: type II toxin-antitoxin system VapC family toxin [Verrucomicrobiota bacterium]
MIVPDINLLVFAYQRNAPHHEAAKRWWEELINGDRAVGIPWVVSSGFIRLMTHPRVSTHPMEPAEALDLVERWFHFPQVAPVNPGRRHLQTLRQMLVAAGVGGNLVTDAHIAAIAVEYQSEVHSNDSDFGRFPGLRWVNPLVDS